MNRRLRTGSLTALLAWGILFACDAAPPQLTLHVYADWNGDGRFDPASDDPLSGITVRLGPRYAQETDEEGLVVFRVEPAFYRPELEKVPPAFVQTTAQIPTLFLDYDTVQDAEVGLRPDVALDRDPTKLVLHGDSITAGLTYVGGGVYGRDGYGAPLEDLLRRRFGRAQVVGRGVPGIKTTCGAALMDSRLSGAPGRLDCRCVPEGCPLDAIEPATSQDPTPNDLPGTIVLLFGTNDLVDAAGCRNQACEESSSNCRTLEFLGQMIEAARARSVRVVVGTLPPGYKACDPGWTAAYNLLAENLNAEIRRLAADRGVEVADFYRAFRAPEAPPLDQLISDGDAADLAPGCGSGLHPTHAGYVLMAQRVYDTLLGAVSEEEVVIEGGPGRPGEIEAARERVRRGARQALCPTN